MDFDELWLLHEQLTKLLSEKITTEKLQLERRLAQLSRVEQMDDVDGTPANRPRRKYPKVQPKYWNPSAADAKMVRAWKATEMACRRFRLRTEVGRFYNRRQRWPTRQ